MMVMIVVAVIVLPPSRLQNRLQLLLGKHGLSTIRTRCFYSRTTAAPFHNAIAMKDVLTIGFDKDGISLLQVMQANGTTHALLFLIR